jgi:hypothetical protein
VRGGQTPLVGGVVTITDAFGTSKPLTSNAAGNFFIRRSDWDVGFPLNVVLEADGVRSTMLTTIGRDGGCAVCHRDAGDATHMPGVFLRNQ